MSVTHSELDQFHRFASEKLSDSGTVSLRDLVIQWEDTREREASVAAIRESISECDSGLDTPLEDAFGDIRQRLGL